jgi:3-methyladenine DNA glycosylase AlkD
MIRKLQTRIQSHADPKKKEWWEAYLKQAITFRGVPMAAIRKEVRDWLPTDNRVDLALDLIREPIAEDKLAGILILAEHVVPEGSPTGVSLLPRMVPLFDDGHIADWNTCDWFCVKFMHRLLVRDGPDLAPAIASWSDAATLWQRRAALVSFVYLAPRGDENWPGLVEMLLRTCATNVKDPQRFSQTGVGWLLRELSKADPRQVEEFVAAHPLSREARNMAMAKITGRGRR